MSACIQWIDSDFAPEGAEALRHEPQRVDWVRSIPFILLHLACLGVIWVGVSPIAVAAAIGFYFIRMFAVTGVYQLYFSH